MAPGLGGSSSRSASAFGLLFGLKAQDRARENENGKHSMMRRGEASSRKQKSWIPEGLAKLEGEQKHPAQFGEVKRNSNPKSPGKVTASIHVGEDKRRILRKTAHLG